MEFLGRSNPKIQAHPRGASGAAGRVSRSSPLKHSCPSLPRLGKILIFLECSWLFPPSSGRWSCCSPSTASHNKIQLGVKSGLVSCSQPFLGTGMGILGTFPNASRLPASPRPFSTSVALSWNGLSWEGPPGQGRDIAKPWEPGLGHSILWGLPTQRGDQEGLCSPLGSARGGIVAL